MLGVSFASGWMQDLKMSDDFTTAASAVIPVIILAAVLEANAHNRRFAESIKRDDEKRQAIGQEASEYLARGEEVPLEVARRYKVARDGAKTKVYGLMVWAWTSIVGLLSGVELLDLYILAKGIENKEFPQLVLANLIVISLGFFLLIFLPFVARAAEIAVEEFMEEGTGTSPQLTRSQHRALIAQAKGGRTATDSDARSRLPADAE